MSTAISKKLWFGHLYLGIALALPLLIIAASGIVLSFYDDLESMQNRGRQSNRFYH